VLAAMPPWQGGGNMITAVTFEKTTYQMPPRRFEAGTGSIEDAVGSALQSSGKKPINVILRRSRECVVLKLQCRSTDDSDHEIL
jgi:selenocysteine lyase/cysteine desulfurase